jgi:hypothetical protein
MRQLRADQIVEDVEWRFGEQNLNNVFLPAKMKQAAQVSTISSTLAISTWLWTQRALGLSSKPWNPFATQTFVGAAVAYAMINGALTMMHTGTAPHGMDFLNFRTGTMVGSQPQRGLIPTEFKEFYDQGKVFMQAYGRSQGSPLTFAGEVAKGEAEYVSGKFNQMIHIYETMARGEDAIGRKPGYMPGGWARWYEEQVMPMILENYQHPKKNTGLNAFERSFMREAPLWITDLPAFLGQQEKLGAKWTLEGIKRALRDNAKLERPKYEVEEPARKSRGKTRDLFAPPQPKGKNTKKAPRGF